VNPVGGASNVVLFNLGRNQQGLNDAVRRLSSGLRINSAADDPSGLAISEKLQAQVTAYDQSTRNIQDASNALSVADGALATVTDVLQRIRSLAIEASSDITSDSDRVKLQSEVSQLVSEVNRISQNTSFNGTLLLDGSRAGFQSGVPATLEVTANAVVFGSAGTTSGPTPPTIVNGDLSVPPLPVNVSTGAPPAGWAFAGSANLVHGQVDFPPDPVPTNGHQVIRLGPGARASQTLAGFAPGSYQLTFQASAVYAAPFGLAQPLQILVDGVVTTTLIIPNDHVFAPYAVAIAIPTAGTHTIAFKAVGVTGNSPLFTDVSLGPAAASGPSPTSSLLIVSATSANANFQTTGPGTAGLGGSGTTDGTIQVQVVNTGSSIGVRETFYDSATHLVSVSSTLLSPNSTAALFDNVSVSLGAFTTGDVGLTGYVKVHQSQASTQNGAALSVHAAAAEGDVLQVVLPAVNANVLRTGNLDITTFLGAEDAIGQSDFALESVIADRARIGATLVRLQSAATDDATASTNLLASESSRRDADIASESSNLIKLQILQSVSQNVLSQLNASSNVVLRLFQ